MFGRAVRVIVSNKKDLLIGFNIAVALSIFRSIPLRASTSDEHLHAFLRLLVFAVAQWHVHVAISLQHCTHYSKSHNNLT